SKIAESLLSLPSVPSPRSRRSATVLSLVAALSKSVVIFASLALAAAKSSAVASSLPDRVVVKCRKEAAEARRSARLARSVARIDVDHPLAHDAHGGDGHVRAAGQLDLLAHLERGDHDALLELDVVHLALANALHQHGVSVGQAADLEETHLPGVQRVGALPF